MPSIPLIKTEKLIRIFRQIGITVDESKGKGSHAKAFGKNGKTIIPRSLEAPKTRSNIAKFLINEGFDLDKIF